MSLSTQPYKGARDFYPEDKRLQKYIFGKMREVAERFGYEEYDAPILEPTELYLSKGNQEIIDSQTYTFQDRGGRSVTIRTEMTPTVSRMVAGKRQELSYPIRWYSIPNLWRYERMQRGRLREFWQLNVDIFGVEGTAAEEEIISLVDALFKSYGATPSMYEIKLNSRMFVNYLLGEYLGFDTTQATSIVRLIDRMHKLPRTDFVAQLDALCAPSQRESGAVERLLSVLEVTAMANLPTELRDHPSLAGLQSLMNALGAQGIGNAVFDVTLMRGFDYYTDIVFEVFDTDPANNRAILGGGRYDGLIGLFGVAPVPTVGFGLGDVTLANFLETHDLLPSLPPETDAYVVLAGNILADAQPYIAELRGAGLNIAVDLSGRKLDKQLATAVKKGIRYAIIIGETEITEQKLALKDLLKGSTEKLSTAHLAKVILELRSKSTALALGSEA